MSQRMDEGDAQNNVEEIDMDELERRLFEEEGQMSVDDQSISAIEMESMVSTASQSAMSSVGDISTTRSGRQSRSQSQAPVTRAPVAAGRRRNGNVSAAASQSSRGGGTAQDTARPNTPAARLASLQRQQQEGLNYVASRLSNMRIPNMPPLPNMEDDGMAAEARPNNAAGARPAANRNAANDEPNPNGPNNPVPNHADLNGGVVYLSAIEQQTMVEFLRTTHDRWCTLDVRTPKDFITAASPVVAHAVRDHLHSIANTANAILGDAAGDRVARQEVSEVNLIATQNAIIAEVEYNLDQLSLRGRLTEEQTDEIFTLAAAANNCIRSAISCFAGLIAYQKQDLAHDIQKLRSVRDLDHERLNDPKKAQLALKLFISAELNKRNYKRGPIVDWVYHQVAIGNYNTRFWKPFMSLLDFINVVVSNAEEKYFDALNTKSTHMSILHHFRVCDNKQFSKVEPMNGILSFNNGILNLMESRFLRYDSPIFAKVYPSSLCSYNLLYSDVPEEGYDPDTGYYDFDTHGMPYHETNFKDIPDRAPPGHFSRITVPFLTAFLDAQVGWDWHTRFIYMWAMGRTLMYIRDGMQCMPCLEGSPGTGKSKAAEQARMIYPPEKRGELMAHCERQFGLMEMVTADGKPNRDILFVPDCDGFVNLDPNIQFAILSNETVTISVKKESPRTIQQWIMPYIINSNRPFGRGPMPNLHFSVSQFAAWQRRVITFPIEHTPSGEQPNAKTMMASMGTYVKVLNLAYHEFNRRLRLMREASIPVRDWIWDHIPKYLSEARHPAFKQYSPICYFLLDTSWFVQDGSNNVMSIETIRHAYLAYMAHVNLKTRLDPPGPYAVMALITLCFNDAKPVTSSIMRKDYFSGRLFKNELFVIGFALAPNNPLYQTKIQRALPNESGNETSTNAPSSASISVATAPFNPSQRSQITSMPPPQSTHVNRSNAQQTPPNALSAQNNRAFNARAAAHSTSSSMDMDPMDEFYQNDDGDDEPDLNMSFRPVAKRGAGPIQRVTGYDD